MYATVTAGENRKGIIERFRVLCVASGKRQWEGQRVVFRVVHDTTLGQTSR